MRLPLLHPSVCEASPTGSHHNRRLRTSLGFECEDCGAFKSKRDEEWYFTNCWGYRQDRSRKGELSKWDVPAGTEECERRRAERR